MLPLGPKAFQLNEAVATTGMGLFFILSGFLIVSNYYSPDHPNGDQASLSSATLQFTGAGDSETYTVTGATGLSGDQSAGFTLSLSTAAGAGA